SAMGLKRLMLDIRRRRSRLRRERSHTSSWASCSRSMGGDQRVFVARARKSSRLGGITRRPICLSWVTRSFVGVVVIMAEEFIVGLQVVRFYIERLQLRVATEVDGWGSQASSGPLMF